MITSGQTASSEMLHCSCCGSPLTTSSDAENLCRECYDALTTQKDQMSSAQYRVARRPFWQRAPVTKGLIVANALVFTGVAWTGPLTDRHLVVWGADWGPLALDGQPWRMLTSLFVHGGLGHILTNVFSLWVLGSIAEGALGSWPFLLLYLLSGFAGEISGLAIHPEEIDVGASGAIFGVAGAVIMMWVTKDGSRASQNLRFKHWVFLVLVGFAFYASFFDPYADNSAHVGGLIAGAIIAFFLCKAVANPEQLFARRVLTLFLAALLLLLGASIGVRLRNGYVVPLAAGEEAYRSGNLDQALKDATIVLKGVPEDAAANTLAGEAYLEQSDYSRAEEYLKRALRTDHQQLRAEYLLGLVYLQTSRVKYAEAMAATMLKEHPGSVSAQLLLAAVLEAEGDHADAGDSYLVLERYDDAASAYEKALAANPDDPRAKAGLTRARQGQPR